MNWEPGVVEAPRRPWDALGAPGSVATGVVFFLLIRTLSMVLTWADERQSVELASSAMEVARNLMKLDLEQNE